MGLEPTKRCGRWPSVTRCICQDCLPARSRCALQQPTWEPMRQIRGYGLCWDQECRGRSVLLQGWCTGTVAWPADRTESVRLAAETFAASPGRLFCKTHCMPWCVAPLAWPHMCAPPQPVHAGGVVARAARQYEQTAGWVPGGRSLDEQSVANLRRRARRITTPASPDQPPAPLPAAHPARLCLCLPQPNSLGPSLLDGQQGRQKEAEEPIPV